MVLDEGQEIHIFSSNIYILIIYSFIFTCISLFPVVQTESRNPNIHLQNKFHDKWLHQLFVVSESFLLIVAKRSKPLHTIMHVWGLMGKVGWSVK